MTFWRVSPRTCGAAIGIAALAGCTTARSASQPAAGCPAPPSAQVKADQLSLPALFPTPRGIIYDAVTTSGSTKVVHAYSASPVDVTFDLYRRDLGSNPYQVTGSQLASQSAEIDFRGSGVNGRIQVSAACQSAGTVDISFQ